MDYFDILLAKKLSGGGGGEITVEELDVEENGTYTAPSGKAYSPVVVNLPLGEKSITANGEYLASADDLQGYSKVTVNVAGFTKKAMPTGAISSFNDGTANPLTKLKIAINPVQASGTPSPETPLPISGWTGANVTRVGKNLCPNKIYQRNSKNYVIGTDNDTSFPFLLFKDKTYTLSFNVTISTTYQVYIREENQSTATQYTGTSVTFTPNITGNYKIVITSALADTSVSNYSNIQLEVGSTATTYEAYNGTIYPISWQTEAGTVYGGELDVTSGVLKATGAYKKVTSSEQWILYSSYNGFYYAENTMQEGSYLDGLCNLFKTISDHSYGVRFGASNNRIYFEQITNNISGVTDIATWKSWLDNNDLYIFYTLATPQTYQLTPTQVSSILGTNNIWADTGDVLEGEYFTSL